MKIRLTSGARPIGQDPDMPTDPDWDSVPPDLAALHGCSCEVEGSDADVSVIVVPAALFAQSRRLREDYDEPEAA